MMRDTNTLWTSEKHTRVAQFRQQQRAKEREK